ncbi:glycosyl transferase family 2 [Fibrisoma limi BUZ 3]|uniref:Glycosyl transferase family 2 n=1 Tax=Fibrisoma limi BUZ 3 TaxID=1185876 RepID=I2GIW5_9BACT|nr:glycosyltransferase family 2 protein [Fibrisoma limi]CCH53840.1 glycosyl transferase family 2 [Fibrisoma limi BUZ 3]
MQDSEQPVVSILIAARNEEATLTASLRAVSCQDATSAPYEVLIGNDQSTDRTGEVAATFVDNHLPFRLFTIAPSTAGLMGKANVLAQLAHHARGRYLFFTDADTQVPAGWTTAMLSSLAEPGLGVVTGVTLPRGHRSFHHLQTIDWLYNLTLTHLVSSLGIPVTAMGNNMAVLRAAYSAVGGYEALPFSVTEDYTLFRAIVKQGYGFRNRLDAEVLAYTQPVDTLSEWLQQRKRWMRGASALPFWMVVSLYVQYLAGPLLLLLALVAPALAFGLYLLRFGAQTATIFYGLYLLYQTNPPARRLWPYAVLFELYQLIIGPLSVAYYWLPTRINWKDRGYK